MYPSEPPARRMPGGRKRPGVLEAQAEIWCGPNRPCARGEGSREGWWATAPGQGPDALGLCQELGLDVLLWLGLSRGGSREGLLGGDGKARWGGHSGSPKAASIWSVLRDFGVLSKTVFKKWFPSYKKSWKSLAGVEADSEEVERPGRAGEVGARAGAAGTGPGTFREWIGQALEADQHCRDRKGSGAGGRGGRL